MLHPVIVANRAPAFDQVKSFALSAVLAADTGLDFDLVLPFALSPVLVADLSLAPDLDLSFALSPVLVTDLILVFDLVLSFALCSVLVAYLGPAFDLLLSFALPADIAADFSLRSVQVVGLVPIQVLFFFVAHTRSLVLAVHLGLVRVASQNIVIILHQATLETWWLVSRDFGHSNR